MKNINTLIFLTAGISAVCLFRFLNSCMKKIRASKTTFIDSSSPSEAGYDEKIWKRFDQDVSEGNFGLINSVLVIYKDRLIVEKYYNGWDRNKLHDLQSATKSITSALVGIAIDKGYIASVDEKMLDFFPEYQLTEADSLKKLITLRHMLTMSVGLQWDENTQEYFQSGNSLTDIYTKNKNWISQILETPVSETPGATFNYNSGLSILLGSILEKSVNKKVPAFAQENLFKPLGIDNYQWSEYHGLAHCGGGLHLTPIDMAKIGYLYYRDGVWNTKNVISKQWVERSLSPLYHSGSNTHYGFQWWLQDPIFDFQPIPFAGGDGGQLIFIAKEFDMVIVFTAKNYTYEPLKTTFSQFELLYGILSGNPQFKEKALRIAALQIKQASATFHEFLLLAFCLNKMEQYDKTLGLLESFEQKDPDNLIFNFLIGEAYLKNGDKISAKAYLQKCIDINNSRGFPEAGYFNKADRLLQDLD